MSVVSILAISWRGPATAILAQAISCSKSSLLLRVVPACFGISFATTSDVNGTQRMAGHRGSTGLVQCDRGPRPPSIRWPNARQPDGVRPPAASPPVRPQFTGRWRQERSKVSPEVVMENARKQVSGLDAAIATMIASGMDENSAEVTTLKGSLTKAKRNAQEAPIARICRSSSEAFGCSQQIAQRVGDRIGRGTGQVAAIEETSGGRGKVPPAVQEPPPEWVSEIHRLRSEVARFKASANRPVRDSP